MSIYTQAGDKGMTGLANGQRVQKDSKVIEFIGLLDELNSYIGICVSHLYEADFDFSQDIDVLEEIQKDLFVVGAICAGGKLKFD